ncbi:hypothetical protein DFJ74DRAFT_650290 [Hyaloraphidium curvatum]|nr:hypothetical protein DFJ74DRAFT_650290 [Hyaloraphidium curvatum]
MAPAGAPVKHKKNLTRKVCIVTGAASGFGEAISRQLASRGAIVVMADRDGERGRKLSAELDETYGGELDIGFFPFVETDLSTHAGVKKVFDECMKRFATVDIVVNNAGIGNGDKFFQDEKDPESTGWETMVNVNLNAVIYGSQLALNEFKESNKQGIIINTASIGSWYPSAALPIYSATKAAVYSFSRSIGKINPKVRVYSIHPGGVATPLGKSAFEMSGFQAAGLQESIETLTPDDIADAMMYAIEEDTLESGAAIRAIYTGLELVRTRVETVRKIKDVRKVEAKAKI